jgi:hypothetical protein
MQPAQKASAMGGAAGVARTAPKVGPVAAKATPARPAPTVASKAVAKPGNNQPRPSTADPSVPGGNMFRLPAAAGDDPYADLLAGGGDRRPAAGPRPPIRAEQK